MVESRKVWKFNGSIESILTLGFEERETNPQYWIKFDSGSFTSPKYGDFHFAGTFPTFLPPQHYSSDPSTEELNLKTMKTIELIKKCSGEFQLNSGELRKIEKALPSSIIRPLRSLKLDEEWEYHFYAVVGLMIQLDDVIEMSHACTDNPSGLKMSSDLLKQVQSNVGDESFDKLESFYPAVSSVITVLKQVQRALELKCPNFQNNSKPLWDSFRTSVLALIIIQSGLEKGGYDFPIKLYTNLRNDEVGSVTTLECLAACQGICVPSEIRSSALFQYALRHFAGIIASVNDVCGLHREVFDEDAEISNLIIFRVVKDKISLNESLLLRVRDAQEETFAFIRTAKYLLQLYPDSEDLELFLILMGIQVDETITIYESERYHNLIKFEVIEGDRENSY